MYECMFDLKFMYVCLHCLGHNLSPIILLSALENALSNGI